MGLPVARFFLLGGRLLQLPVLSGRLYGLFELRRVSRAEFFLPSEERFLSVGAVGGRISKAWPRLSRQAAETT